MVLNAQEIGARDGGRLGEEGCMSRAGWPWWGFLVLFFCRPGRTGDGMRRGRGNVVVVVVVVGQLVCGSDAESAEEGVVEQ